MDELHRNDMDLKSVITKVQLGDKQCYTVIIHRFQKQIYLYCYYLLRNQEEAEDATQDIFIKGLEHINRFVYTVSFSAWLYKIARNHSTDLMKKKNKEHKSLVEYKANRQQDQEHTYTDYIHDVLEYLNLEEKQILLLRSLEEYSYDEIASIMELKPSTVRKKYERLRKKLVQEKEQGVKMINEHSYRTGE
jgi:RNA polymerase sigma-70 factor (ECF subfamily)